MRRASASSRCPSWNVSTVRSVKPFGLWYCTKFKASASGSVIVAASCHTTRDKTNFKKQNFNAVVKWIKADAALCKMNGSSSTVFRQHNSSGGGQDRECGNVTDYNKTPFHENVLQTHIGYIGVAGKNPYGSVGSDRACDIWKGWTDMTSIQSAHLGKKMCNGQIGLYSETVEQNGCD